MKAISEFENSVKYISGDEYLTVNKLISGVWKSFKIKLSVLRDYILSE